MCLVTLFVVMKSIGILALLGFLCLFHTSARSNTIVFYSDNDSSSSRSWIDQFGDKMDSIHRQATRMYDSLMTRKMRSLRHIADSVTKVAKRIKDSLNLTIGGDMANDLQQQVNALMTKVEGRK